MPDEQPTQQAADAAASSQAEHLGETLPGVPRDRDGECTETPPQLRNHPRYRIERLLGRGGMGAVYQATHLVMARPVALKVMRCELTGNADAVERFRREVRAAAQLSHPNIVAAFDAEQVGDIHFLVMEYVEGRSLAEVVARGGPLPVAAAVDFAVQAANGLQHAFERGMIHRDIKPHNLMISESGIRNPELKDKSTSDDSAFRIPHSALLKILDFGLARFASDEGGSVQTASGMILGTVDFMAPEQADNARAADVRSDIYSLGCTLYYLLAGRVPFPEGTVIQRVMAHVRRDPPPLDSLRPGLPAGLLTVVAKMLAKEPAERFQTPADVARALAPFTTTPDNSVPTLTCEPLAPTIAKVVDVEVLDVIPIAPPRPPKPASSLRPRPRREIVEVEVPVPTPPSRAGRSLLGCFLLAVLAIVGVLGLGAYGIWLIVDRASRGIEKVMDDAMKESKAWDTLVAGFSAPPSDAANDRLFPKGLGERTRGVMDARGDIAELDVRAPARHAAYGDGDDAVHVYLYNPLSKLEKEALFRRAVDAVSNEKRTGNGGYSSVFGGPTNDRMSIHLDRTDFAGKKIKVRVQFAWLKNVLIAVRSPTDVDPQPLLADYLNWLIEQQKLPK